MTSETHVLHWRSQILAKKNKKKKQRTIILKLIFCLLRFILTGKVLSIQTCRIWMQTLEHICTHTHTQTHTHTHTHNHTHTLLSLIHAAKSGCWVEVWITQTTGAETSGDSLPGDNWIICNSTSLKKKNKKKNRPCVSLPNKSHQSIKVIKHILTPSESPRLTPPNTRFYQGCLHWLSNSDRLFFKWAWRWLPGSPGH